MTDVTASRTLVKSPPELWTECSQAETLSRHLDSFGEIRITRLEPESAVAWEGELASGTVRLEPSGWGTRVVLTATPTPDPVAVEAETESEIEAEPVVEEVVPTVAVVPEAGARGERGVAAWLRRLFGRRRPVAESEPASDPESDRPPEPVAAAEPAVTAEPVVVAEPAVAAEPEPEVSTASVVDTEAALGAALDSLGRAHHRPFSRV